MEHVSSRSLRALCALLAAVLLLLCACGTENSAESPDPEESSADESEAVISAEESETERRRARLTEDAESLEGGIPFRRMRAWITVLTDRTGTVCDWFRPDLILLCEPDRIRTRIEERNAGFAEDLASAMARGEAVQGQETLLTDWEGVRRETAGVPAGVLTEMLLGLGGIKPDTVVNTEAAGIPGYGGQIRLLKNDLAAWKAAGMRIYLLSGGSSRGKRLQESLRELGEETVFSEDSREAEASGARDTGRARAGNIPASGSPPSRT